MDTRPLIFSVQEYDPGRWCNLIRKDEGTGNVETILYHSQLPYNHTLDLILEMFVNGGNQYQSGEVKKPKFYCPSCKSPWITTKQTSEEVAFGHCSKCDYHGMTMVQSPCSSCARPEADYKEAIEQLKEIYLNLRRPLRNALYEVGVPSNPCVEDEWILEQVIDKMHKPVPDTVNVLRRLRGKINNGFNDGESVRDLIDREIVNVISGIAKAGN